LRKARGSTKQELQTSLWSRPFVEDCPQSLPIEPQPEAVFLRKLRDLCLSIFLVKWPEASQFRLVNNAMLPFANLQFAVDLARKCFHATAQMFGAGAGGNCSFSGVSIFVTLVVPLVFVKMGLLTSSALNEVKDQDDDSNYEQEVDQAAAKVADEAKKPEHD
jgi:hypothetical protein